MYKEAAMEKEMKKKIDIEGNGNGGRRTPSLRANSRGGSVSGGREGGLGTGDLDGDGVVVVVMMVVVVTTKMAMKRQ